MASKTKKVLELPRAGTLIRGVADRLLENKSRKWFSPANTPEARACRTLRDRYDWPIEDQPAKGEKYYEYRLDPERRGHYRFGA